MYTARHDLLKTLVAASPDSAEARRDHSVAQERLAGFLLNHAAPPGSRPPARYLSKAVEHVLAYLLSASSCAARRAPSSWRRAPMTRCSARWWIRAVPTRCPDRIAAFGDHDAVGPAQAAPRNTLLQPRIAGQGEYSVPVILGLTCVMGDFTAPPRGPMLGYLARDRGVSYHHRVT
jgi:hypothetical protein